MTLRSFIPNRHSHTGNMVWETDFCGCKKCGQRWVMTDKGWVALPEGVDERVVHRGQTPDPYKRYRSTERPKETERDRMKRAVRAKKAREKAQRASR